MKSNVEVFNIYNESKVSANIKQVSLQLSISIGLAYKSFKHEKTHIRTYLQQLFKQAKYDFNEQHIRDLNIHHETIFYILGAMYFYVHANTTDLQRAKHDIGIIRTYMYKYKNKYIDNAIKLDTHSCLWSYLLTRNKLITINDYNTIESINTHTISYKHNIDISYTVAQLFNISKQDKYQGINSYNNNIYNVIHYKPSTKTKFIEFKQSEKESKYVNIVVGNVNNDTIKYLAPWNNDARDVPVTRINTNVNYTLKKYNALFLHAVQAAPLYTDENKIPAIDYIDGITRLQDNIYNVINNIQADLKFDYTVLREQIKDSIEQMIVNIIVKTRFKTYFNLYKKFVINKLYEDMVSLIIMKRTQKLDDIYANIKLILNKSDNIISVLLNYNGYTNN